jgi:hypothetical protein
MVLYQLIVLRTFMHKIQKVAPAIESSFAPTPLILTGIVNLFRVLY